MRRNHELPTGGPRRQPHQDVRHPPNPPPDPSPPGPLVDTDNDGFTLVSRRRRPRRCIITGSKSGTSLRSVAQKVQIFVSRLEPDLLPSTLKDYVKEIIDDDCEVEKRSTRYPSYSSFVVTCDFRHKESLLNPEEWEDGVIIRRFYGMLTNRSGNSHGGQATHSS